VLDADLSALTTADAVSELVYELLDAHADTVAMASGWQGDPDWAAHLGYLRDLQRVGREVLARRSGATV
jgi:hypothetical protein